MALCQRRLSKEHRGLVCHGLPVSIAAISPPEGPPFKSTFHKNVPVPRRHLPAQMSTLMPQPIWQTLSAISPSRPIRDTPSPKPVLPAVPAQQLVERLSFSHFAELVQYALADMSNKLFVSRYQVQLPGKAEMAAFLHKAVEELGGGDAWADDKHAGRMDRQP